ncbi:sigma-70 family RNA polymerase sigma factor [Candidatus Poribacteria bacterium]|nr:sigma-70 family RNA polymerase sigma factor [Candidatus Poribacteria bacterium]
MANDSTLIDNAQTGNEGAFADLMREYYSLVYTIVIRIVDNPHDVEEVVQDTFLSAYQGLTQLEDTTKFKSWLAEIARNCARQWVRKQRGKTISLDEVGEGVLQTEDFPDERLERQEQRELIRRTMETLPQIDRDIARAFYLEGASYDELTRAHGLSYNAIAFRLFHIKRKLSKRLRYLLTGVFVTPGLTLKKLYSGGLNIMKVGTVPKITIGAAGLIAVIFIGFIGIRQMNAPAVEERVYLSPWEDGTTRPQNNPEGDTTQDTESRNNLPQIAAASTAGTESIDDFFDQPDETDMTQFATEAEFELNIGPDFAIDTSASSESAGQSAENVMYAYLEAWRSSDYKVIDSLRTEQYRRSIQDNSANRPPTSDEAHEHDEVVQTRLQILAETIRELRKQTLLVNSEYTGDEFHFRLRIPDSELQGVSDHIMPIAICISNQQVKMQKENGMWRVYKAIFD